LNQAGRAENHQKIKGTIDQERLKEMDQGKSEQTHAVRPSCNIEAQFSQFFCTSIINQDERIEEIKNSFKRLEREKGNS
jgi:hypothetical protein